MTGMSIRTSSKASGADGADERVARPTSPSRGGSAREHRQLAEVLPRPDLLDHHVLIVSSTKPSSITWKSLAGSPCLQITSPSEKATFWTMLPSLRSCASVQPSNRPTRKRWKSPPSTTAVIVAVRPDRSEQFWRGAGQRGRSTEDELVGHRGELRHDEVAPEPVRPVDHQGVPGQERRVRRTQPSDGPSQLVTAPSRPAGERRASTSAPVVRRAWRSRACPRGGTDPVRARSRARRRGPTRPRATWSGCPPRPWRQRSGPSRGRR